MGIWAPVQLRDWWWCVYDKDHMSALRIRNTSESDPRSYEVTKAVTNKTQKKFWHFNGFEPMTSAIPVRCSTNWAMNEASAEAGQVQVQFIPVIWWEWYEVYMIKIQYNTIQYNTIQCDTIQYNTIQYNTIQHLSRWKLKLMQLMGPCSYEWTADKEYKWKWSSQAVWSNFSSYK